MKWGRLWMLACLLVSVSTPAVAEVRTLEAVGAVSLNGRRGAPRDAAIQKGLREAVYRVAREFLLDADPGAEIEVPLSQVLGREMVPYTARFRILEDRGSSPALFTDNPQATHEYVVIVEVQVDADRVKSRLVDAGLLVASQAGFSRRLRIDIEGLDRYAAYESLRGVLVEDVGARSVVPVAFERGRTSLDVEVPLEARQLLEILLRRAPVGLAIEPVEVSDERIQLSVRWTPPPDDADTPPVGSSGHWRSSGPRR